MPDYIGRKRLKKKMLDRWENEGGKVSSEQTTADKDGPTNDHPFSENDCFLVRVHSLAFNR